METRLDFLPKTLNIRHFTLDESEDFFFLTGTDKCQQRFQLLTLIKCDDTRRNYSLKDIVLEDKHTFTKNEFDLHWREVKQRFQPLTRKVHRAYGILGFIRFLKGYYLVLIT